MKELKFIHITKTAGTSIEDQAMLNNIQFGRFHHEYGHWHQFFKDKPISLKLKYDWFTVVRNPYSRIVSEFHCQWGGVGTDAEQYDVISFNNYVTDRILKRDKPLGHYAEQFHYIDRDPKIVIHVLKFEKITEMFNKLMLQYGIDLQLNLFNNKSNKKFNTTDLSKENILLINKVYAMDFYNFDYEKL